MHDLAAEAVRAKTGEKAITLRLRLWWAERYKRPLKDPLLDTYTMEELLFEAACVKEHKLVEEEESKDISDKIDEDKLDEVMSWAEAEERREAEAEAKAQAARLAAADKGAKPPPAEEPLGDIVASFTDQPAAPEVADGHQ